MKKIFSSIYLVLIFNLSFAKNLEKKTTNEAEKKQVDFLLEKALDINSESEIKNSLLYIKKALKISNKIEYKFGIAKSYNTLGRFCYELDDNVPKALDYFFKSLSISKKHKFKNEILISYEYISDIYDFVGDSKKAFLYNSKSFKYITNDKDKAYLYLNQGHHFSNFHKIDSSIFNYNKAIELYKKINFKRGLFASYLAKGQSLLNFADFYSKKKELKKAKYYNTKGLNLCILYGDSLIPIYYEGFVDNISTITSGLNQSFKIYRKLNDNTQANKSIDLALEFLKKVDFSLMKTKEISYKKELMSMIFYRYGEFYAKKNEFELAKLNWLKALKYSEEIGNIYGLRDAYEQLSMLFEKQKDKSKAFYYYKLFNSYDDSINKQDVEGKVEKAQLKNDFENIIKRNQEKAKREQKIRELQSIHEKTVRFFLFAGLISIIVFSFFIYKRFITAKKQKEIIEIAHVELEHKNREILDSITYAKRIQSAILPQPKLVKEFLEDSFILYKPKDIVAGDFYWLEVVGDTVLFAAADCTGHGVPGAMVSVVCNNGLNRAVREHKLIEPDQILNKTRELVVEEFEKSDEEVKDGMDISLCALDTKTNTLKWAGANNPLWILRNGEIIEKKGDKQPIGKHFDAKPFSLAEFQLEKDDIIYIFTDGYQDQFGGPKEKKFRVAQMRELFLSLTSKTMEEQRKIINESFENWKGVLEQVDDVCVIGVRVGENILYFDKIND